MRIFTTAVLVGLITANLVVYAQDTLTFEEAIKIGLENNVLLNTQKNQLYSTQARKLQGYANYLPGIRANAVAERTDGLQIDPRTGQGGNVTSDFVQGSISADYMIFNGFNRINTVKQNNHQFLAQDAGVKRSKQDVVFNVTSQYLQVLLDQELLRIAEENLNAQKVLLEQTKGFVEVGSRAAIDEYNQNALVQNFQVSYLQAKIRLENDKALLAQTLQLDPSVPFLAKQPSYNNSNVEYFNTLTLDSLYSIALSNRQDLKQQNYLVDAAKFGYRANSSGYYPTLSIYANYGSFYFASDAWKLTDPPGQEPEPFREQFSRLNPSTSYGASLTIPIFDRLQTRTSRVVTKITYDNAVLTRDNLVKSIKIDVQQAFKNYHSAVESYLASQAQFDAAELALNTQQESYELGISSQAELALANQIYVQAASSKAQSEVTLVFQQMLLEYALGTLKVEALYGE